MYKVSKISKLYFPSQPIPIPKKTNNPKFYKNKITECELKLNFFNPDKFSPPNSWNTRLMLRLNSN
jgi:hypothetical protein